MEYVTTEKIRQADTTKEALRLYDLLVEKVGHSPDGQRALAAVYLRLGQDDQANRWMQLSAETLNSQRDQYIADNLARLPSSLDNLLNNLGEILSSFKRDLVSAASDFNLAAAKMKEAARQR